MKNLRITSIISYIAATAILVAGLFMFTTPAEASVQWSSQWDLLEVSNFTQNPGATDWSNSTNADPGDTVTLLISLYNTGSSSATNTRVRLTPKNSSADDNHTFSLEVSANGQTWNDTATVRLPENLSIESLSAIKEYDNQKNLIRYRNGDASALHGSGMSMGTIPASASGARMIAVGYRVDTQSVTQNPVIDANTVDARNIDTNSALLRGEWEGDDTETRVWFEYADTRSELSPEGDESDGGIATNKQHKNKTTGWKTFTQTISGLQDGTTYYFKACVENTDFNMVVCDSELSFTTTGTTPPPVDPECSDGYDNDNDGYTDYPNDPSCYGPNDDDESPYDGPINNQDPYVHTNNADVAEDDEYVTLDGEADMHDYNNGTVFFVWGEDRYDNELRDVDNLDNINDIDNDLDYEIVESDLDGNDGRETYEYDVDFGDLDTDEDYLYMICVEYRDDSNDDVIECGGEEDFSFDIRDDKPDVSTDSPNDVDEDSAELRGEYDMNDFEDGDIFFVWSDDEDDLDGVEDEDDIDDVENYVNVEMVKTNANHSDTVRKRITGLDENTRYYYQLCVLYEDEDNDDVITCGRTEDFETDDDFVPPSDDQPTVNTCSATGVGFGNATLSGSVDGNRNNTTAYFQYGTTTGFGQRTSTDSIGRNTSGMSEFVSGLTPDTTYYCRIVAENSDGQTIGGVGTFRTRALTLITPQVPNRPVTIVSSGGSGSPVVLIIDNEQEITTRGQIVTYDVEWGNVTQRDLEDVILHIQLPKSARFQSATRGTYNRRDHTLTYQVGILEAGEEDDLSFTTRIGGGRNGDPVVAEAILAFEDPRQGDASFNAIEYDNDTYTTNGSGLVAGLFGIGFLPGMIGILLAILILLIIVLVARRIMERREEDRNHPYA